ncbi:carbohydrate binding-domain-containing protein [Mycena vulgaris]|nr:carbohydrate binding-domain-containing protein [Mycena vulgaris]KAJ6521089.1 carbohydrate binding-domain-containing protein [Mycena vulgaris]
MARLISIVLTAFVANAVSAQTLASCGTSKYDPSQYTCYGGSLLCPIVNGNVYLQCGNDCYSRQDYTCTDGFLCPINGPGGETFKCGDSCFDPRQYSCQNGKVVFTPCVEHFGSSEICDAVECIQLNCCPGLFSVATKCRSPCDFTPCTTTTQFARATPASS